MVESLELGARRARRQGTDRAGAAEGGLCPRDARVAGASPGLCQQRDAVPLADLDLVTTQVFLQTAIRRVACPTHRL